MGEATRLLSFPAIVVIGLLLSRGSPEPLRSVARSFAVVLGVALLCIIATGWGHGRAPAAAIHRWLSHAHFILLWVAVPLSIGVAIAGSRGRPLVAIASSFAPLSTLGAIFLASITGYLGPSYGPLDTMAFTRFRVLHYGVFPALAVIPSAAWYYGLGAHRDTARRGAPGPPTDA